MEHKHYSLADQVFDRLERDILTGVYPRDAILTELGLCEDLGVSRTPIREAITRLSEEHLIDVLPKGIRVLGITEQDLRDIYEIRKNIEGIAAAYAAKSADEEGLEALREALELQEYYVEKKDADRIKSMDSRFHEILYTISKSNVLHDTLLPLHRKVQRFRKSSVQNTSRADKSVKEHRAIYEKILARDEAGAFAAMQAHVASAMEHILGKE